MPTETVTLVLDKAQYERALADVVAGQGRLSRSGERIGEGFLRGDRAVRRATQNIVQGLTSATSASDALLISGASLERVFKIPLGLTVFAAAGLAIADGISKAIEKTITLNSEIIKLASFSRSGAADFLGTDQITQNLDAIKKKIEELSATQITRSHSLLASLLGTGGISPTAGIIPAQNAKDQEKIDLLQKAAAEDVNNLISKQNDLNRAEQKRLDKHEDLADLDKLEIDHNERLGKLAEAAVAAGVAGTNTAHQLLSVENDRYNIAVAILKTKQDEARLKGSIQTAGAVTDFFADVGSGRFRDKFAAGQRRDFEADQGRKFIDKIQQGQEKGFFKDPLSQAMLRDAEKLAKQEQTGLTGLLNADFTNLLDLSRYDFSGLLPLSGLTLQIQ